MYLFSVLERNAGCFFVLVPFAKEFGVGQGGWVGKSGGNKEEGVGMPIKLSLSPTGMCPNVFNIASLGVLLSAALALNWI